ncbi:hypothetical protein [Ectothiorhodospira lacustris]|uniref:hypothetical protein n=1 Tax=Ectothiorhodospira lacustris TaxID=2899127 RepID=UPI001EE85C0C|nr:hypothetical protein [Ectothiorhodospira lacustris]MCG5510331.1 hypothetical protein [Ectothiorhodospira lacustris]MCG5522077.1 hypothetical protein [Ectothiorhodospira lacustris]
MRPKKRALQAILLASVMLCSAAVSAAPVLLGALEKDYGMGAGKVAAASMGAGSCDGRGGNSITIRNSSGCQRFYDAFDFSGFSFGEIDHLALTISYSNTNASFFFVPTEFWNVRPAASPVLASDSLYSMTRVGGGGTSSTFVFDGTLDIFDEIVASQSLFLWFAHTGAGSQNFNLFSAHLEVWGTAPLQEQPSAVPEPKVIGLLLMGLLAMAAGLRRSARRAGHGVIGRQPFLGQGRALRG